MISPFPVTNSTLSTIHLAEFIQKEYQLANSVSCKLLKTGISHTYLITTDTEKFVFRIYSLNWRTKAEILEEIRLVNLLKENEVTVSYPIADADGEFIKELNAPEGTRFGVLFSHAKGAKLINYSTETHFAVGQSMAQIHRLTENFKLDRVNYTSDILLTQSFERLKLFLDAQHPEMIYMADLKDRLKQCFLETDFSKVRNGAVHLDIWFDNMHFTNQQEVTIFDFDFCGNGPLVLDIGYYVMQLYHLERDETEYKLKLESFLKGYESIIQISDEEKRSLPFFSTSIYFFYLGIQCQRFDNWANVFLNEIYLERYIKMIIKRWADHNKILSEPELI
ncbi:phosphotransferase [Dyadobacter sp. CY345]|uniref:phosphotransferase n=1 Tax=Dyadobacter sp. CY345 TaxID=2909335 RepID=UPI001F27E5FA|nr:phosphotransferase [Dyadobacter sp. CY345]MCF2444253.1 phosphotransferase [Dyadobacter sp. CY345]